MSSSPRTSPRTAPRFGRRLLTAGFVATVALSGVASQASAADSAPAAKPDLVKPLQEYENYWKPVPYDKSTPESKKATAWHGSVTDAGNTVLSQNDSTLLDINHKGQADEQQSQRALVDADYEWEETVADSLGTTLGSYFIRGVNNGELPLTKASMASIQSTSSTGDAKPHYNYPRPFLPDRSFGGKSDLKSLKPTLDIHRVDDWTDPMGKKHSAEYQELTDGYSQAFPSGHTTFAYQAGVQLAMLVPELGPEALTRSSEAGNNRIVLGVHYPLDVMGGRIAGHINASSTYADPNYVTKTLKPARTELKTYLTEQCRNHGQGNTLEKCIQKTRANDAGGYKNAFTDSVSKAPVTDRASALTAYKARMTYGFGQVGKKGQAARVPANAEDLLVTAFPDLTKDQRRAVLAATEIDSGYVLDSSSDGWQRINLAAAMSSKVTLDRAGHVVSVKPGQGKASVEKSGRACGHDRGHGHGNGHGHGKPGDRGGHGNSGHGHHHHAKHPAHA